LKKIGSRATESARRVRIIGIENATIENLDDMLTLLREMGKFQLMDAGLILNEDHVRFACFEAMRSFEEGCNIASTIQMEILLKAAATTQISEAIARLGATPRSRALILVALDAGEEQIESVVKATGGGVSGAPLEPTEEKRERVRDAYGLQEPVERALLERIALSSLG
jgi:tRNA threonylcarbamoyladenosine modification (KEOPS) complex Cgi121 subunit